MTHPLKRFSVIGAGNLGTHFLGVLAAKGYTPVHIYKKARCPRWGPLVEQDPAVIVEASDFVIIATQESAIGAVADEVAAATNPAGKIFFHTANSLTSDELGALRRAGAHTASFSPLQTFAPPGDPVPTDIFDGVYFLAEGDPPALDLARQMADALGAHMLTVKKEDKIYYHMAAVSASNFLVSILRFSEKQLQKVGGEPDINILMPLIRRTLDNIGQKGVAASLTGPLKRGETGLIRRHLQRLRGDEAALYQTLTDFLKNQI